MGPERAQGSRHIDAPVRVHMHPTAPEDRQELPDLRHMPIYAYMSSHMEGYMSAYLSAFGKLGPLISSICAQLVSSKLAWNHLKVLLRSHRSHIALDSVNFLLII